jgi:hypothetical protein
MKFIDKFFNKKYNVVVEKFNRENYAVFTVNDAFRRVKSAAARSRSKFASDSLKWILKRN